MKLNLKFVLFTIPIVVLSSTFLYAEYVNSQNEIDSNDSQYFFAVIHVDFLENSKDIEDHKSILKNLSSKMKYSEVFKETGQPIDEVKTMTYLNYDEGQKLISTFDELFENTEIEKKYRSYHIVFDEKYYIVKLNNCGGPCPPYE